MSGVRVLVGTRKGAFVLTSDAERERWDITGPHFAGWEIHHLKGSPADLNRLYASQYSNWFGQLNVRLGGASAAKSVTCYRTDEVKKGASSLLSPRVRLQSGQRQARHYFALTNEGRPQLVAHCRIKASKISNMDCQLLRGLVASQAPNQRGHTSSRKVVRRPVSNAPRQCRYVPRPKLRTIVEALSSTCLVVMVPLIIVDSAVVIANQRPRQLAHVLTRFG